MLNKDNIIKGRIAETIVSEMLQDVGYFLYRFGYEGILQSLIQPGLPKMRKGDPRADKVRSMPDFIIMDKSGSVDFIEVKYRSNKYDSGELRERIGKAAQYWPEARLIIVHPRAPHFVISTFQAFAKTGKLYPLEQDRFLRINKKVVIQYVELVNKYFR